MSRNLADAVTRSERVVTESLVAMVSEHASPQQFENSSDTVLGVGTAVPSIASGWPSSAGEVPDPWTTGQVLDLDFPDEVHAENALLGATEWLRQQQNPFRGSWPGIDFHNEPLVQSTAWAVIGLSKQSPNVANVSSGKRWLRTNARRPGGWQQLPETLRDGRINRYASVSAVRALLAGYLDAVDAQLVLEICEGLSDRRAAGDGWGYTDGEASDPTYTCYVLDALMDLTDRSLPSERTTAAIADASEWLAEQQNEAGFFSDWMGKKNSLEGTLYSAYVLYRANAERYRDLVLTSVDAALDAFDDESGWPSDAGSQSPSFVVWRNATCLSSLQKLRKLGAFGVPDVPSVKQARSKRAPTLATEVPYERIPHCKPFDHTMSKSIERYVDVKVPPREIEAAVLAKPVPTRIEVHGVEPNGRQILEELGYFKDFVRAKTVLGNRDKRWNFARPNFYYASSRDGDRRLLCLAASGEDYVSHYASLIKNHLIRMSDRAVDMRVFRYLSLEENLFVRLGLDVIEFREGDCVVLGYVDEFAEMAKASGFTVESDWHIQPNFGWARLRSPRGETVVFIGVALSYWGSMAGILANGLYDAGVETILYFGKLGTLGNPKEIYSTVFCPDEFLLMSGPAIVGEVKDVPNVLRFGGARSGVHASVPTVIEESYEQRSVLDSQSVVSIDNEISHFALAASMRTRHGSKARFGCAHFATDYVRPEAEARRETDHDLANNRSPEAMKLRAQVLERIFRDHFLAFFSGQA